MRMLISDRQKDGNSSEEMLARYTINGTIDSSRCFISLDKKGPQISVIDVFDGTVYTNLNGKILTKDAALKVDSICDSPYGGIDSQRVFMTYTSPDGKNIKTACVTGDGKDYIWVTIILLLHAVRMVLMK